MIGKTDEINVPMVGKNNLMSGTRKSALSCAESWSKGVLECLGRQAFFMILMIR
jgi:hypothetical protein